MTDQPITVEERRPIYFRLNNDIPAMAWPSPEGSEAIIQIGRDRPFIADRYNSKDKDSLNVILIDLLAKTIAIVDSFDWHTAMGTGIWPDGNGVNWHLDWRQKK